MPNEIRGTSLALQKRGFGGYVVGPAREAGRPNFSSRGSLLKSSPYLKKEKSFFDRLEICVVCSTGDGSCLGAGRSGLSGRPFHPRPIAAFQTPPSGILWLLEWVLSSFGAPAPFFPYHLPS